MEMYKVRNVDFQHKDDRGILTQLIHEGYQQINILESLKGVIRGEHFHKISTEAFYLIYGSVKVEFMRDGEKKVVTFNKGDFFEIPPLVIHTMIFNEDCLMVQMYDVPVKNDKGVDIYTVNDI